MSYYKDLRVISEEASYRKYSVIILAEIPIGGRIEPTLTLIEDAKKKIIAEYYKDHSVQITSDDTANSQMKICAPKSFQAELEYKASLRNISVDTLCVSVLSGWLADNGQ